VGGHRIQRVPPTERKGRVHTSTVTVAVTNVDVQTDDRYDMLDDEYFRVEWFSGTGKGGQHRNKHQNSCRMFHIPTGLMESRQGRKREANLKDAKQALLNLLTEHKDQANADEISAIRKHQVGSGMRGDKVRTYRFQEDRVIDHNTNKTLQIKKVFRGNMDKFWK